MGGVNSSPDYIETVGIGGHGGDMDVLKQGGIVAIFYVGCIIVSSKELVDSDHHG